jgi:transposase-like protein
MQKSDMTCPKCGAGYRRIELISTPGAKGEFHCVTCDEMLEQFDGSRGIAIRLTVQPAKRRSAIGDMALAVVGRKSA